MIVTTSTTSADAAIGRRERPRHVVLRPDSLAVRLTLFAVVLVVVTAAVIGALAYTRARHALEREARGRLAMIAYDVAQSLRRDIADRAAEITSWANLEVMRAVLYGDVDKEVAQFIRQVVTDRQAYLGIICLDAHDQVIAQAGDVRAAVPTPLEASSAGGAQPRASLVAVPGERHRLLQFETAIFDPDRRDRRSGGLLVLVDPQPLLRQARTALGAAGSDLAFELRSGDGAVLVAAPESAEITAPRAPVFMETARVGAIANGGPALRVAVAEPAERALAAVTALRGAVLKTVSVVLLLGSAFGVLVAWRIGRPIRRLTKTVREMTEQGEPRVELDLPAAHGEVGLLAAAFRALIERLAVAQAEAVMQSRLALLGEIAASVAHEVRTPLSVLKTSAQLLARHELPAVEQRELASALTAEVDRLNSVVTDLVDLARPKRTVYRAESLPAIIHRAVAFFATTARKSGVALEEAIAPDVPPMYGSADQMYQVLLNLVHNALQALSAPGRIVVRCGRSGAWIVTDVEDTGPGFAPEILPKAFSRFCTTKPDGTGLGLAISRRIVEEHGGTIVAENLASGARVRIRLPVREDSA